MKPFRRKKSSIFLIYQKLRSFTIELIEKPVLLTYLVFLLPSNGNKHTEKQRCSDHIGKKERQKFETTKTFDNSIEKNGSKS